MGWTSWRDALLELLFPGSHLCHFCWQKIEEQKFRGVCDRCIEEILRISEKGGVCVRCGCYISSGSCPNCRKWPGALDKVVSVVPYKGIYREIIADLKYTGRLELVKPLGYLIAHKIKAAGLDKKGALLMPVPLHPVRETERGFNQSSLLAHEIASLLRLRCEEAVLKRIHYAGNQTRLSKKDRLANIKEAFEADWSRCRQAGRGNLIQKVILIDDIITTGATLNACAAALKKNNAVTVAAAVWAAGIAPGKNFSEIAGRKRIIEE